MSITKVAKLAGVSSSTVSRVINRHPRVAPETERSVRRAMEELGYAPSDRRPGPKPLSRQQTETKNITFLVFGATGGQATPAFANLLRGVSIGSNENHANLSFHYVPNADELPNRVLEHRTDGVLLHGVNPGPELEQRLRRLPTVWLMGNRRRPNWGDQVMPDSYEVGHLAGKYLIDRGHRHLAFLNLDAGHWPFQLYHQGMRGIAADHGVDVVAIEEPLDHAGDYWRRQDPAAVKALVNHLLSLNPRPTGLFVADDMQVAVLQPALQAAGITLAPGQTQIISCNDEKPFLVGLQPRPARIDIRIEAIGRRAIEQLLWRMSHVHIPERIISTIEPSIVPSEDEAAVAAEAEA
jgi:LacI family transcriptional regulator